MALASAQWVIQATVDVPFDFAVVHTVFPAGSYEVLTDSTYPKVVVLAIIYAAYRFFKKRA